MSAHEKPPCFGKSWNGGDVVCKGGLDPTYTNPRSKTHKRDQCVFFTQCAHQTNFNRMRGHIPVEALTRNKQPVAPRSQTVQPAQPTTQTVQQNQQVHPGYYQQPTWNNQQMVPPYIASYGPQMVPMPYQQPGAQMPGYLTVPEPIDSRVPLWIRFLLNIGRAAVKAIFHTGAHMADHETIIKYQPPKPPPG